MLEVNIIKVTHLMHNLHSYNLHGGFSYVSNSLKY